MDTLLKILILEDSIADVDMIRRLLKKEKMSCEFSIAMNKKDFLRSLSSFCPDVILSDNSIPQFNSSDALLLAREQLPYVPFILVTGNTPEEFAANIIKSGADDYILKDRMTRLPAAIAASLKQRLTEKEKQETVQELKDNETRYRTLVERVSDGFVSLDLNWCFTYINNRAAQLFNKEPHQLRGKNIWLELPAEANDSFYKAFHLAIETTENIIHRDYSFTLDKWIEANIYPSATGLSVYFKDITEQQKAAVHLRSLENKIQDQKIQEQKKIARAILVAGENERCHVGLELHDNINQILVGSKLYLSIACKKSEAIKKLIEYPTELIGKAIEEIRLLTSKLVIPIKDIDLEEAVADLLADVDQNSTTKANFVYQVSAELLGDDLKLNIYRVMQEVITNIAKHAMAKNISVSMVTSGQSLLISVADDGRGFNIEERKKGIGMSNMRNRIESFNGKMEIDSSPGNGCQYWISIPC